MNEKEIVVALSALAQETRLRIVRHLVTKASSGASAGEISQIVSATASRTSFHLSVLSDAGLITSERDARSIIYRIDFDRMGALTGYLVHDCCQDNAAVRACC